MRHAGKTSASRGKLYIPSTNRLLIQQPSIYIRDSMRGMYDNTPLQEADNTGVMKTAHWFVDGAIFTHLDTDAFMIGRNKAQSANGEHLVSVHRFVSGHMRGRLGDLSMDRDPGAVYMIDLSARVECVQRRSVMQNIFFPKAALGFHPDRHPPLVKFPRTHPLGRLINAQFAQLYDGLLGAHELDLDCFDQFVACLKLAMGANPNDGNLREKARAALFDQICRYIERNLQNWDLSVGLILRNFGVSRASLYRLFDHRGGVRQYISDRRLLSAVLDLAGRPLKRGDVSGAAEKWGFSSNANFNRAVRRAYGVTPGTLVETPAPDLGLFSDTRSAVDLHWRGEALRHRRSAANLAQMAPPP